MSTTETTPEPDHRAEPAIGTSVRHRWWLAIFPLVLSFAALVVPPKLSWSLDTPMDLIILLAFVTVSTWVAELLHTWRRSHVRPGMIWWAIVAMITSCALLIAVAQSPPQAFHRLSCTFGTFGFGSGAVWIKVEPTVPPPSEPYHLEVQWGSKRANIEEKLYQPTYFTMQKEDFFSRERASITVEPETRISCGNGVPPHGEISIDLNRDVWN